MAFMMQVRSIWVPTNGATCLCVASGAFGATFSPSFLFRNALSAASVMLILFPTFAYIMLRFFRWLEETWLGMTADVVADRRAGFLFPGVLAATSGFILGRFIALAFPA